MWDELDDVPFEIDEEVLEELIEETIEEVLAKFRGYEDPFWYAKKGKKHHNIPKPMVRVQTNPGTKPDREVRWKNYPKQAGTNHMKEFLKEWEQCHHCKGWGCSICCKSEEEIRGRQGIFS